MKFSDELKKISFELESEKGYNVLQCTYNESNIELNTKMQGNLKEAHFKKIDFCGMIYVVDIDGYIGASVKKIEYAKKLEKEIVFYSGNI